MNHDELRASIERYGILQPLIITPEGFILNGVKRYHIAKELNLTFVPTVTVEANIFLTETNKLKPSRFDR